MVVWLLIDLFLFMIEWLLIDLFLFVVEWILEGGFSYLHENFSMKFSKLHIRLPEGEVIMLPAATLLSNAS